MAGPRRDHGGTTTEPQWGIGGLRRGARLDYDGGQTTTTSTTTYYYYYFYYYYYCYYYYYYYCYCYYYSLLLQRKFRDSYRQFRDK